MRIFNFPRANEQIAPLDDKVYVHQKQESCSTGCDERDTAKII